MECYSEINSIIKIDINLGIKYNLSLQELAIYDYIMKNKIWTYDSIIKDNPLLCISNKKTIYKKIEKFKKLNILHIEKMNDTEVYNLLNKKNSKKGCLFCGYDKCSLDNHHYPIRTKDGGKDTIKLCPNCHRRFHDLADYSKRGVKND